MTTTPTLPPLPDEDGYILITIAGRPVEVNGYRNSTMEAYALAAYQAGRNAGIDESRQACKRVFDDACSQRKITGADYDEGAAYGAAECGAALNVLKSDAKGGV